MKTLDEKEFYGKQYQSALDDRQEFEIIFNVYYGSNSVAVCEEALKTRNFLAEHIKGIPERIENEDVKIFFRDLFGQLEHIKHDFDPKKKFLASAAVISITRHKDALESTYPEFFLFD